MKHVFIINPAAGKVSQVEIIENKLEKYNGVIDYEIYITKCEGDAKRFCKEYMENTSELVRFYACGGDGTLFEVVNGVATFENASVACYASGSGNDFVKNFANVDSFKDLDNTVNSCA